MICPKCSGSVPDGSAFCNHCGRKLPAAPRPPRKPKARGNGQGTAYKVGKAWTAEAVVGYRKPRDESHQPIPIKRTKAGFPSKAAALAYCPILRAGGIIKPSEAPRLSSYWETYSENKMTALSASKQTAYKIAWKRLEPLHDVRVDTLTVQLLQATINKACLSYYTARDCKALLTSLFKLSSADGFTNKDLPSLLELPKLEEAEQIPFSQEEQTALWKRYENGDLNACIPLLMIYTGMMPGEAQGLKLEQIDLSARQIIGAGMKTKVRKKTPIVLAECILPVVQDLMDHAQPSGYIWPRNEKAWYDNYYAALEAAGCRKLTPYSCRHTTATALAVTENIAPQTVRKVMRWSTAKMLDRYAHPETSDALAAVDSLKKHSVVDSVVEKESQVLGGSERE